MPDVTHSKRIWFWNRGGCDLWWGLEWIDWLEGYPQIIDYKQDLKEKITIKKRWKKNEYCRLGFGYGLPLCTIEVNGGSAFCISRKNIYII